MVLYKAVMFMSPSGRRSCEKCCLRSGCRATKPALYLQESFKEGKSSDLIALVWITKGTVSLAVLLPSVKTKSSLWRFITIEASPFMERTLIHVYWYLELAFFSRFFYMTKCLQHCEGVGGGVRSTQDCTGKEAVLLITYSTDWNANYFFSNSE